MRQSRKSGLYRVWNRETVRGWVKSKSLTFPFPTININHSALELTCFSLMSSPLTTLNDRSLSLSLSRYTSPVSLRPLDAIALQTTVTTIHSPFYLFHQLPSHFKVLPPLQSYARSLLLLPLVAAVVKRWINCHNPTPFSLPLAKYSHMLCRKDVFFLSVFSPRHQKQASVCFFRHTFGSAFYTLVISRTEKHTHIYPEILRPHLLCMPCLVHFYASVCVKFKVSCSLYWVPMLSHQDGQRCISTSAGGPQSHLFPLFLSQHLPSTPPSFHPCPHGGTWPAFVHQCLRGLGCGCKCLLMHACALISVHAIMCSAWVSCVCGRTGVYLSCHCVAWPDDHKLN